MAIRSKEEVIQELQKRNIEFDGGASRNSLLRILKQSERKDTTVNAPGSTVNEDDQTVEPLEATTEAPKDEGELCWNCAAQGEKNYLDAEGKCAVCGFEKNKLYNGDIEAEKAAKRQEAAQAAFNKTIVGRKE